MFSIILMLIAVAILGIVLLLKKQCSFWKSRGIVGPTPVPIFGNLFSFVITKQQHIGEIYKKIYDSYQDARYVGIFKLNEPALLIRDLNIVRDIMISNFNVFNKNDFNFDPKTDPLIAVNPFLSHGETWKTSREILSPLFSPNKVKASATCVNLVSKILENYLETNYEVDNHEFCAKDIANKFTTDVIVRFALSVDGESFTDADAEFRSMGDKIFKPTFLTGLKQQTVLFLPFMNKFLRIPFISKSVDQQFRSIIKRISDSRRDRQPDDLLKIILDLCQKYKNVEYDDDFVAGHSMSVVKGAYETSSTNMAYALYELALNQNIQSQVQNEVDSILEDTNGELTEKALTRMEYLEQCLMETARMHSPFFHTSRVSLQDFEIPPQFGDSEEKVKIDAGVIAVIPISAIHYDPKNYQNPSSFDPDRWSKENQSTIPKYAFLGFGQGPRLCVGMKFGLQQVKGGVARILSKYTVVPCKRTDIPEKFSKATFNLQPENGLWLKFNKRDI